MALEQAEEYVQDREYDLWAKAAYVAASNSGKKVKITELIGEHPSKARDKKKKQAEQPKLDKDALRKIALDKGLNPNF